MRHSKDAYRIKRELEAELRDNAEEAGEDLCWSAADAARIDRVMAITDRIADLQHSYDALGPEEVKLRMQLSTELRLHDQALSRVIGQIDTRAPKPATTAAHVRAKRAANARWHGQPEAGPDVPS